MVHRVKSHRWNRGVLETLEYFFESEELARTFAKKVEAHTVKVINDDNEVIDIRTVTFDQPVFSDYSGADSDYSGTDSDYSGADFDDSEEDDDTYA